MDTSADLAALQISGFAPGIIRELSGIYPTFVSAFKELVSNAHDADATRVTIRFSSDLRTVTVEDNGKGMTPLEFQDEYIRIGGSVQHRGEDMTDSGRRPIGRKGIGFLAIARYCHQIEILSHADRNDSRAEVIPLSPQSSTFHQRRFSFPQGPLAHLLQKHIHLQAVQCGGEVLKPGEYSWDGCFFELENSTLERLSEPNLAVEYTVDCHELVLRATIDYDYLLSLGDNFNLAMLQDFCRVSLLSATGEPGQPFTRITLHLHEFVRRELQTVQRRGRVRNIASVSGLERFLWHLSRSTPVSYDLSTKEFEQLELARLTIPMTPTPFIIRFEGVGSREHELRRPLLGQVWGAEPDNHLLATQPVWIDAVGLRAQGYLLGFARPVFPAELRGIAVRVRGVEIGRPSFLGAESEMPARYRPLLSQVMGEVIATEGLDAITAIMPGREGFYNENTQFQALSNYLVGDRVTDLGALGQLLDRLYELHSVESSVARIVQENRRRREAFLAVGHAITSLSVGSHYGRALRRLFARTDVGADGLCSAPEHQVQLPHAIGNYTLELADLAEGDFRLDEEHGVVLFNSNSDIWTSSLYMLGRDFLISLRNGGPSDPICELDLATNTIYVNWMHPSRSKMGDSMFVKTALFWRIAYLAANGDVDLMMNLAHRLLSFTS
jgi:hypothetical protein